MEASSGGEDRDTDRRLKKPNCGKCEEKETEKIGFLFLRFVLYFLLLCVGETGETPVRARRREACSILFSTGDATVSGTSHWRIPRR